MTFAYQRRRDPVGFNAGWELAVAALAGLVFGVALAALIGLGVAALLFGGGWVWPRGLNTIGQVLGGMLTGHPGRGLPVVDAGRVPGSGVVYLVVAVLELLLLATLAWSCVAITRRFRNDGMATRWEAQQALGVGQLREAKAIIRPDLYGRDRDRESS